VVVCCAVLRSCGRTFLDAGYKRGLGGKNRREGSENRGEWEKRIEIIEGSGREDKRRVGGKNKWKWEGRIKRSGREE